MSKSKTTWIGILGLITTVSTTANNLIQGLPVQWEVVIPAVMTSIGLIFAGDANPVG